MDKEAHSGSAIVKLAGQYGLTEREQQTLSGICSGLSNKELAVRMQISPNTVKAFVHIIMLKMGVATRAEIAARIQSLIALSESVSSGGTIDASPPLPHLMGRRRRK